MYIFILASLINGQTPPVPYSHIQNIDTASIIVPYSLFIDSNLSNITYSFASFKDDPNCILFQSLLNVSPDFVCKLPPNKALSNSVNISMNDYKVYNSMTLKRAKFATFSYFGSNQKYAFGLALMLLYYVTYILVSVFKNNFYQETVSYKVKEFKVSLDESKQQKLKRLKTEIFNEQITVQRTQSFRRLYHIWSEFAHNPNDSKIDINGLINALKMFGMAIDTKDTHLDFPKYIFDKFKSDEKNQMTFNDFSSYIALWVSCIDGSIDHQCMDTLFQIFDIENKRHFDIEDIGRILLSVQYLSVCVKGFTQNNLMIKYTKEECLQKAKENMIKYGTETCEGYRMFDDGFKSMMKGRSV